MIRLAITACVIVCLAVAAGCGGNSSSTGTATTSLAKPNYGDDTTFEPFSGPVVPGVTVIGGAVQQGAFSAKVGNYTLDISPPFSFVGASFNNPLGVTTDGVNHYVANFLSHKIVKIDNTTGVVTHFAGSGFGHGFANLSSVVSEDKANFKELTAITTDGTDVYVTDIKDHAVRKIDASGMVSLLAGDGKPGNRDTDFSKAYPADRARFSNPSGLTVVGKHVYVADTNNHTIRAINTDTKVVTTFAGFPGLPGSADGGRKTARFNQPARIASDGQYLYVTDFGNRTVRRISLATGTVDTIAGIVGLSGNADGIKGLSRFNEPNGIATDGVNLYVTDVQEGTVRKISVTAPFYTSTIWSGLDTPVGITTDGHSLHIADRHANSIVRIK